MSDLHIKLYELLKDKPFDEVANALASHIQRIMCDEGNNEKDKSLNLLKPFMLSVEDRITTVCNMNYATA